MVALVCTERRAINPAPLLKYPQRRLCFSSNHYWKSPVLSSQKYIHLNVRAEASVRPLSPGWLNEMGKFWSQNNHEASSITLIGIYNGAVYWAPTMFGLIRKASELSNQSPVMGGLRDPHTVLLSSRLPCLVDDEEVETGKTIRFPVNSTQNLFFLFLIRFLSFSVIPMAHDLYSDLH